MERRRSSNLSKSSSFRSNQSRNERRENRIVEIVNKSTQSELEEEQQQQQNAVISASVDNESLIKENDDLKKNIELIQQENSELRKELKNQINITERIQDAYESAIKERNNLLMMINDLRQQVKETKAKLGQELIIVSNRSNTPQKRQQQQDTLNTNIQKINVESFRNEIKAFKRCMLNNTKILNNTTLKDKMDNLTTTASRQSQRLVGPSTSIQAIRDKRNLRGLKDKLEKTLVFPDTGRSLDRPKQDHVKIIVEEPEVSEKVICDGINTKEKDDREKISHDGTKNEEHNSQNNCPEVVTICYAKTGKFSSELSNQNLEISETTKLNISDQNIQQNINLDKVPSKGGCSVTSAKTIIISNTDKVDMQSKNDQPVHSNKLDSLDKINQPENSENTDLSNKNTLELNPEKDEKIIGASGVTKKTETKHKETKDTDRNIKDVILEVNEDVPMAEDGEDWSNIK